QHRTDEYTQNRVNRVEVCLQAGELVSRSGLVGGDAEIEIDMGIDTNHQLLHHDWIPVRSGVERHLPAQSRLLPGAELLERLEIAIGKVDVQLFHARPVLEASSRYSVFHRACDPPV